MWSANCGTNWAETDPTWASFRDPVPLGNANITRWGDSKHYDGTWYSVDFVYSPMVFAPSTLAQACGSVNNMPGGCTLWR